MAILKIRAEDNLSWLGIGSGWTWGYWTSTSWDGDAKSASGIIDLSAVFGLPAGINAISCCLGANGPAINITFRLSKNSSSLNAGIQQMTQVNASALNVWVAGIVECDANGDVYFSLSASLSRVYLYINGYLL